jgi:hypothetical protein
VMQGQAPHSNPNPRQLQILPTITAGEPLGLTV